MCGNCKQAVERRTEAAAKLFAACSGRDAIRAGLKLVYPVEPVPYDMREMAMRIGGQA
jgi:hypothetical protein